MGRWSLDHVKQFYGVPAKRGIRVIAEYGGPGVITCGDGPYVRVRLDGERRSQPHHPLSLDYLDGVKPADREAERNAAITRFNEALNKAAPPPSKSKVSG